MQERGEGREGEREREKGKYLISLTIEKSKKVIPIASYLLTHL